MIRFIIAALLIVVLGGAAFLWLSQEEAQLPEMAGYGPNPTLPEPNPTLLPTVNIAPATQWPEGATPTAAEGFTVNEFAGGLDHPRWLLALPNGDVLVAESNAQPKEDQGFSLRGWAMGLIQGQAGAEVPSADRITLLRDADGDGVAEVKETFLDDLTSPFGMALSGNALYVANTDAIVAFPYEEGATSISAEGRKVADLPAGPINHHWTKDVIASQDGSTLYATVGSNSNVGENGIDAEENRAAVLEIDPQSGQTSLFASGLRNPNGLSWNLDTGELWVVVNERDEIGSDLVPDYITSVEEGGFYGWPYSYFGQHVDDRVEPPNPELVQRAIKPDYAVGSHTGSLGLTFYDAELFPPEFRGGAFVGQHGSWNRNPPAGYRVIFIPFAAGEPSGEPREILTGFINGEGEAQGRPVGVEVDATGALLVADDVGNKIWRVVPSASSAAAE